MSPATATRPVCLVLAVLLAALASPTPSSAQVAPEEHEKHHPRQDQKKEVAPGGMMGGMGGMMGGMGKSPPKELYPSLMGMPELSPEQRAEVERLAGERMRSGTALMKEGLDRLTQAAEKNDYAAMQEATAQVREGLSRFDSGVAAQRALGEGKAPRDIALQWFKREMNLSAPPTGPEAPGGPFGLSWFHFFVMVLLIGFAAVMLWMYFHKMRRATELLKRLTGSGPAGGAAEA